MAKTAQNAIGMVAVAAAMFGMLCIPFFNNPAAADNPSDIKNPRRPGYGLVVVSELQTTSQGSLCDPSLPPSSTKGGLNFRFIVPSTITTIKNSNSPQNGVNLHIAFKGSDGNYYEAGMYYGSWTAANGIGYNPNNFQLAWGQGGLLRGVSTIPVVAGHEVEISLIYLNSAGNWQAWFSDRTTGSLQAMVMGYGTVTVASDLLQAFEANTNGPNANTNALGLVSVKNLSKATRVTGDGVTFSDFTHGYVVKNCPVLQTNNYGVTYNGAPGVYQIGLNGATKTNGAQLW